MPDPFQILGSSWSGVAAVQGDDPDGQGPDSPGAEQQGRHLGAVALAGAADQYRRQPAGR